MGNPYEPPQTTQCRGCGDSGCPHKPKEKLAWWQAAVEFLLIMAGMATIVLAIGFAAPLIEQAIRAYQGK